MKLIAQFNNYYLDKDQNLIIQFKVEEGFYIEQAKQLEQKDYGIEIREVKSRRSLQQNRLMWALIREIAQAMGVNDEMEIYCHALTKANIQYAYILTEPKVKIDDLRSNFRAVQLISKVDVNGREANQYKVFIGSSRFTSEEMSRLIDSLLDMASELDLEVDYWQRVL